MSTTNKTRLYCIFFYRKDNISRIDMQMHHFFIFSLLLFYSICNIFSQSTEKIRYVTGTSEASNISINYIYEIPITSNSSSITGGTIYMNTPNNAIGYNSQSLTGNSVVSGATKTTSGTYTDAFGNVYNTISISAATDKITITTTYTGSNTVNIPAFNGELDDDYPISVSGMGTFLASTTSIQKNNADVKAIADLYRSGYSKLIDVVEGVAKYIRGNISYCSDAGTLQDAASVAYNQYGNCTGYSNLIVAVLRNLGIPARVASGICFDARSSVTSSAGYTFTLGAWGSGYHAIYEVYYPRKGWVQADAQATVNFTSNAVVTHGRWDDFGSKNTPFSYTRNPNLPAPTFGDLVQKTPTVSLTLDAKYNTSTKEATFPAIPECLNFPLTAVDNTDAVHVIGISLDQTSVAMDIGDVIRLFCAFIPVDATDKSVTWSSSDPWVADVYNGDVTTYQSGTAIITATTNDGGHTASCLVTVKTVPVSDFFGAATSSTQVQLNWTADPNNTFLTLKRDGATLTTDRTLRSYIDNVASNAFYTYTITGTNQWSTVTLESIVATIPPTVINSNGQITISWTAIPNAAGYVVQYSTSPNGPFTTINITPDRNSVAVNVTPGETYYYKVGLKNASGNISYYPTISVTACLSGLPATGAITGNYLSGSTTIQAQNIASSASAYVGNSAILYAEASNNITFNPGFIADVGSTMVASIVPVCSGSKAAELKDTVATPANTETANIEESISIFPNPSNGSFTVSLNNEEVSEVEILNLYGQLVQYSTNNNMGSSFDISLPGGSKGMYLIRLSGKQKTYIQKIVVE